MVSPWRARYLTGFTLLAGLCGTLSYSTAQEEKGGNGEKVKFQTIDGVELSGVFYPGKKSSATVLMLHALEEDSRKKNWISLAEALNAAGNAVLTFDFRGHGQSKAIDAKEFWKQQRNVSSIKGAPRKETLEFKDMISSYYPILVNDIAAAKAFLDHRNDTGGACNTSNLVVLGAENGATLGALWLNAEWHRYMYTPQSFTAQAKVSPVPEGKNTIAAVWLSASSKLGGRSVSFTRLLDTACKLNATPVLFMYSDEDMSSKNIALACSKAIKGSKKDEKKYGLTGTYGVKAGKLKGAGLLQPSLGIQEKIVEYIGNVVEAKAKEWEERDFRRNEYVWILPGSGAPVTAKVPGEKTLQFDTYERFLPQ